MYGSIAVKSFKLKIVKNASIATKTLKAGSRGKIYNASLKVSGGLAPYNWSLTSGTLPAGLALQSTGRLTGVPTELGVFHLTIRVTDTLGGTAEKNFTLTIN
jgi:hypothetical protein